MLGVLVAVGLLLRIWVLLASQRLSADEAIPGLMARHILVADELPVFYWGQAYFGAAEAYLVAGLFAALGFHPWLVFVPALLASTALIALEWSIADRIGSPPAGLIAALPLALPPPILSRMLGNAGGGFALGFALQLGAILCLIGTLQSTSSRARSILVASCALLAGLAGWVWQPSLLTMPLLVGVLLACVPELRAPRFALLCAPALLGLAPLIAANARDSFPTLQAVLTKVDQTAGLRPDVLLVALGGGEETFGGFNPGQALLLAASLVLAPLIVLVSGSNTRRAALGVLLGSALLNTLAAHGGARYLAPLLLCACVCAGIVLAEVARRVRAGRLLVAAVCGVVFGVGNLVGYARIAELMAPEQVSLAADTQQAIATLQQRGLSAGYADYWTAYPITYVSGESIVLAPSLPFEWSARVERYPPFTRHVDAVTDPSQLFLLVDRRCAIEPYLESLDTAGASYVVEPLARWRLVSDIRTSQASATLESLRATIGSHATC